MSESTRVYIDGVELDVSDLEHLPDEEFEVALGERIHKYLIEECGAEPESIELADLKEHEWGTESLIRAAHHQTIH